MDTLDELIAPGTCLTVPRQAGDELSVQLVSMTGLHADTLGPALAHIPPWSCYNYDSQQLARYLATKEDGAPRFALCLANQQDQPIGALGLRENWLRGPYIQFLGLDAAHHGQGIGTALLTLIETRAKKLEQQNLWVMASQINDRALSFYHRFGFQSVAEIPELVVPDKTEILLRKALT